MSDYISKSALVDALAEKAKNMAEVAANAAGQAVDYYSGMKTGFASAAIMANSAPTIEPKKGRWKDAWMDRQCSLCGIFVAREIAREANFCPNCGAKMEMSEDGKIH